MFNMMYGGGYGWDGGWFGWVGMIFWWVIIIMVVLFAVRWFSERTRSEGGTHGKSPLEILQGRYARGEIEKKEFEEKRKALEE